MRYRIILLMALIASGLMGYVNAAPPAETWYFAQTDTRIVAYNANGNAKVLLETVGFESIAFYRLDDQSAVVLVETPLAVLSEDTTIQLYYLTSESATPFTTNVELSESRFVYLRQQGSYLFFFDAINPPASVGLLANLDTLTLEPLSENLISATDQAVRFSADGQFLRYVRQEAEESWTIRELSFVTGEERVIYPIEQAAYPLLIADNYGDNWLYLNTGTTTRIHNDGTTEVMAAATGINGFYRTAFGDSAFIAPFSCEVDCTLELQPLAGGDSSFYSFPAINGGFIPQHLLEDGTLLIYYLADSSFWSLGTDGSTTPIGYSNSQASFTRSAELISPDRRWLTVMNAEDDSTGYKVWDVQNGQYLLENDFHEDNFSYLQVFYSEDGFVLWESSEYAYAYRNTDQSIIELPLGEERNYFTILPDGTLLYQQTSSPGIYRYDPDTQTETLLVESGVPLVR